MNQTKQVLLFGMGALLFSCQQNQEKLRQLSVENLSNIDLTEKSIKVSLEELGEEGLSNQFPRLSDERGQIVPSQLIDNDGDGNLDELFFLIDLKSGEKKQLGLDWAESPAEIDQRTYVRFGVRPSVNDTVRPAKTDTFYPDMLPGVMGYQPYQTDGPSWENDKVGFRHYLDGRNSKDVFGKKIKEMSPVNVGINEEGVTEDNYHVMEDWGRDILSVEKSLGLGGYSLKVGEDLLRLGVTQQDSLNNVSETTFSVKESGPLFSLMHYDYKDWKPEGTDRNYQVHEETEIWPGMYAFKNTFTMTGLQGDEEAIIGLVNNQTDKELGILEVGDFVVLFTHDKQTYDKVWYMGLGLILPKNVYLGWMEAPSTGQITDTFLARMKVENNKPISYYAVASWELSDSGFTEQGYFKEYILGLAKQLDAKVKVEVQK
ncbi:DUF4861 domain-containing protein [Echinicola marina]|uniref:DUF4861 domain-containing protein n=1 Tax=Echinicola marina TaxID=2859768 RepID=UPI001CF6319B|nr:DUF4861 domain-containing protein [Echinicola marina]UCS92052.1 DUF4861 domain-containing protein [Echinicola marina]